MFIIEDTTINITRGNNAVIGVTADAHDDTPYTFQNGDIIRFAIYEKGNYNNLKREKLVTVNEETEEVKIELTKEDTKIDDIINKPVNYWYEIELIKGETVQTILGHDENGAKVFRLYPEGVEEE